MEEVVAYDGLEVRLESREGVVVERPQLVFRRDRRAGLVMDDPPMRRIPIHLDGALAAALITDPEPMHEALAALDIGPGWRCRQSTPSVGLAPDAKGDPHGGS